MDLSNMSSTELRALQEQIAVQLRRVERREKEEAIERIYGIAHSVGLPLSAILDGVTKRAPKAAKAPPIQWRDPTNPQNVWIGKGPRPAWLKSALAAGVSLDLLRAA